MTYAVALRLRRTRDTIAKQMAEARAVVIAAQLRQLRASMP